MGVVTGAAGFIGNAVIWQLNAVGVHPIVAVDAVRNDDRWVNLLGKQLADYVEREQLDDWLMHRKGGAEAIIHLTSADGCLPECSTSAERSR